MSRGPQHPSTPAARLARARGLSGGDLAAWLAAELADDRWADRFTSPRGPAIRVYRILSGTITPELNEACALADRLGASSAELWPVVKTGPHPLANGYARPRWTWSR